MQSFAFRSSTTTFVNTIPKSGGDRAVPCCWTTTTSTTTQLRLSDQVFIIHLDDDDDGDGDEEPEEEDEDDEPEAEDPYRQVASSEFDSSGSSNNDKSSALTYGGDLSTNIDWGGALGKLRQRQEDIEGGKAGSPSQALFRLMSAESPNQSIGSFISKANPQVVQAMSGAVGSLLGGLSSPQSGVEILVKSTGDKIGSLCFQLQMTGCVIMQRTKQIPMV